MEPGQETEDKARQEKSRYFRKDKRQEIQEAELTTIYSCQPVMQTIYKKNNHKLNKI